MFRIKKETRKNLVNPLATKKDFGGWYQIDTNLDDKNDCVVRTVDRNQLAKQRVAEFHHQQTKEKSSHTPQLRTKTAKAPSVGLLVKAALIYAVSGHSI